LPSSGKCITIRWKGIEEICKGSGFEEIFKRSGFEEIFKELDFSNLQRYPILDRGGHVA